MSRGAYTVQSVEDVNLAQVAGAAVALGQTVMASSLPVVIASDQTSLPVTVGNFPATQAVSGTVTANQGTSPWVVSGTVISTPSGTQAVNLSQVNSASIALGQALMAASLPVVIASNQTSVPVTVGNFPATVAVTQSTSPWVIGDGGGSITVDGAVAVSWAAAQHVIVDSGSITFPATQDENLAKVNGITVLTGTGATGTGSQRVTVAVDTATVAGSASLPTGSNAIGKLAANDGVDIGDVTVNNAAGAASVNIQDGGNSITVDGTFFQTTQPVSGTFWQATQPVSGPLTDTQLRASAVPVTGTITSTPSGTQDENVKQVNGVTVLTGTGATGTGSQRITVAVDSATVAGSASLPTGTNSIGQVTANAGTNLNTSLLALESGGNLASIKAKTDNIPAQGQALAAASLPVVLTAAQVTTLTPPAAITGFNLEATQAVVKAVLDYRFSGGKSVYVGTIAASGNTTAITPASGKRIQIFWVMFLPNSDNAASNLVKVGFGTAAGSIDSGKELYRGVAMAHWEPFTGLADKSVIINAATAEPVYAVIHYLEIA